MINLDNMRWYHKLWFVPLAIIGMIFITPIHCIIYAIKKH